MMGAHILSMALSGSMLSDTATSKTVTGQCVQVP